MTSTRSALVLILLGLLGACFFWVTDPWIGWIRHLMPARVNFLDASQQAWPGTLVGLIGSAAVVLLGLWLLIKRPTES